MKIIALYSIKGGVGKTAASVNLSYLAAKEGASTLLCDLDPQGSASYYFRTRPSKKFNHTKLLKGGKSIDKNIKGTNYPNLELLPADFSFRNLDVALAEMKQSKNKLKDIFKKFANEYEYIFLDCPPNITLMSENVFVAADVIVVPCIPTTLSMLTYKKLFIFFKEQKFDRKKIQAFFCLVDLRKKMHQDTISWAQSNNKRFFFKSLIPYLAEVEKMGLTREPLVHTRPDSKASRSYSDLWNEIKINIQE